MNKVKIIVLIVVALIFVVSGAAWFQFDQWYKEAEEIYEAFKRDAVEDLQAALPKMKSDQKALQEYEWMHDQPCVKDAGMVLNTLIEWDNHSANDWIQANPSSIERPDWKKISDLSYKLLNKVPKGGEWMAQGENPDVGQVHFPWMKELRSFDCWNITQNSPIAGQDFDSFSGMVDNMTYPNGIGLMSSATLMLMQLHQPNSDDPAVEERRVVQTLMDVRTLAQLTLRSQHMVLMSIGASILEKEQTATLYLVKQGRMPSSWKPIPQEDIERLKRLVRVGNALSNIFTPKAYHDVIRSKEYRIGRCAGIREGLMQARMFKGILEKEQFVWLDAILEQGPSLGCNLEDIAQMWSDTDLNLEQQEEYKGAWQLEKVTRGQAMVLAHIAIPNWLGSYTK